MAFSDKTKVSISIGVILTVLASVGGGAYHVAAWKTTQDSKDENYERRTLALEDLARATAERGTHFESAILAMQEDLKSLMKDRFSLPMAAEVALRTKIANPAMTVIDPRDNRPVDIPIASGAQQPMRTLNPARPVDHP